MQGTEPAVLLMEEEGVASIVFNRPQRLNAFDADFAQCFLEVCERLRCRADLAAIVLQGRGRAFMAGGDISAFQHSPAQVVETLIRPMNRALQILVEHPAPVIASVQGAAAGAGMSIALACDLVIAARSARFDFAYLKLAASCDLGMSWHLPRLVGLRKALEIALLGEPLTALDAQELGLVNWVVEDERLALRTQLVAERFTVMPRPALGEIKRLLRHGAPTLQGQLEQEAQAFARVMSSDAFKVAVSGFLSKPSARQPAR